VPLSITASSTAPDRVAVELLAVPVAKSDDGTIGALGPGADVVDAALAGGLAAFLEETGFEGRLGDTLAVPTAGRLRAQAAIIVGIGDPSELTVDGLRRAAAAVAKKSRKAGSVATTLAQAGAMDGTDIDAADAAQAVTEGLVLGGYQYLDYKGDAKPTKLRRVTLLGPTTAAVRGAIERGSVIGDAVVWARDLVNRPRRWPRPRSVTCAARGYACRCSMSQRSGRSASAACSAWARARSRRHGSSR
jgi:leucyl aminopeptidase